MKGPEDKSAPREWPLGRLALGALFWALLCALLLGYDRYPGRLLLHAGDKSPRDVIASRTTRYVDPEETQRLREEAADRTAPVYRTLSDALTEAETQLRRAFDALEQAASVSSAEVQQAFPKVSQAALSWVAVRSPEEREQMRQNALRLLREEMATSISDRAESLGAARAHVRQAARRFKPAFAAGLIGASVAAALRPNRAVDPRATELRRQMAFGQVKEVERTLRAGDIVLLKGQQVAPHHLAMLRALGLSSPWGGEGSGKTPALVLLALLGVVFLGVSARQFSPSTYRQPWRFALLGLIVCGSIFLFHLFLLVLPNPGMLFLPAATLAIAVLLSPHLALAAAVVQAALAGLNGNLSLPLVLPLLGSCLTAVLCAGYIWPPSRLLRGCLLLAGVNVVLIGAAGTLAGLPGRELGQQAAFAFGYGIFAPLLALAGILLLERPFDIASQVRLLELCNPREPLLRRLQVEAPGTYYSSVVVANLAEGACQSLGADALLARVGALYHDIGKLRRPALFAENQALLGTENAHSQLCSSLSALIILAHVRDGMEMARRQGLPRSLQRIIEEHHGTTLVSYFYHQARASQAVTEEKYRYAGRRPRSKESAVVMLADAAQAAAKSLPEPSSEKLAAVVQQIISDRLQDGQLEDCDLSFRDLTLISQSFHRSLQGIYLHTRVEYPAFMRVVNNDAGVTAEPPETAPKPGRPQARRFGRDAG